jgi:predicted nucleic acid-binding protein
MRLHSNLLQWPNDRSNRLALPSDYRLNHIVNHNKHVFWEDNISLHHSTTQIAIRGHQQVTDAYLLSLCLHRGGRLATFGQAIFSLASNQRDAIFLLPS